ncbi:alpha/beta hydrolase family esterase [Corynebacterium resistens]|uniref:alpha/beta hydrolase family esterase n=1 Tax=Corynebacterium resistens TaxID=258224 RepID=UPI002355C7CD|nr:alpha/beta hydrolase-fold protein [Corynebacterium resistens]
MILEDIVKVWRQMVRSCQFQIGSASARPAGALLRPLVVALALAGLVIAGISTSHSSLPQASAAPAPAPAPKPVPKPAPAPKSAPIPAPGPKSAPQPAPVPKQALKPAPAPKPASRPHAAPTPHAHSNVTKAKPGEAVNVEFTLPNGHKRRAIVSVTKNYNPARSAPVLFGFGGWHDSPENFRNYSRFSNTGAANEAIVVYPAGVEYAWEGAPYSVTPRGGDVAFARQIVDELDAHFNVDRKRIYAAGMSNGGGFAVNFACQAPDFLAGVVSVSGAFYNPVIENCVPGPVPTFIIHGAHDELTHFDGGQLHRAPYHSAPVVADSAAKRNLCAPRPVVEQKPGNTTQFGYPGCAKETVFWRINDQGHNWYFTPDVANEVWNFLARQHR